MVAGARVLFASEHPAGPAAAAALRIGKDDLVCEVQRVRLADGKPIVLERSLFPADRFPGMLDSRLDGSLYELLEVRYGLRPHRARESLEPVTARVREAEALEVPEGAPLMLVERIAYARSGEPLEYARDLFRGDRTKVVVWTSELEDLVSRERRISAHTESATVPQLTAAQPGGRAERRAASRGRGHRVARYRRVRSRYRPGGTPTRGLRPAERALRGHQRPRRQDAQRP